MISSLEYQPAKNGTPASAIDEIVQQANVTGIFRHNPPMSFFMSKEWCEPLWATEPAQRNRQHLKKAWVQMWNTAGVHAPTPRPIIMYPSWLTVEYASTFLMSVCTKAKSAATMMVMPPITAMKFTPVSRIFSPSKNTG